MSITLLRCATLLWLRFQLKEASRISVYISCLHVCLLITGPHQLQSSYRPFTASGTASPAVTEVPLLWNNAELVVSSPGAIARCFRSRTWRCQVHSNPRSLLTLSPQVQVILCLGGIIACWQPAFQWDVAALPSWNLCERPLQPVHCFHLAWLKPHSSHKVTTSCRFGSCREPFFPARWLTLEDCR